MMKESYEPRALTPPKRYTTAPMSHELIIAPSGRLVLVEPTSANEAAAELSKPIVAAFAESPARGLLHLATNELQTRLPPALDYVRSFARTYLTRLCQTQ